MVPTSVKPTYPGLSDHFPSSEIPGSKRDRPAPAASSLSTGHRRTDRDWVGGPAKHTDHFDRQRPCAPISWYLWIQDGPSPPAHSLVGNIYCMLSGRQDCPAERLPTGARAVIRTVCNIVTVTFIIGHSRPNLDCCEPPSD